MTRQLAEAPAPPPPPDPAPDESPRPAGRPRRAWARPLWAHAAALAVVLVALVPFIGADASFSADEGAAIIQAQSLSGGRGWTVEHPVPEADPTETNYPLELSIRGPRGTAPFAKHPLYALLLAGADRLGGITGMVLLSVAGTVVAAALAAALAARMGPLLRNPNANNGLARPTLWLVGLASPLAFDGYLVIAHTLGAAGAAGAVLFALRAIEGRPPGPERNGRRPLASIAGVGGCLAFAVLLRNEAVFLALGLAVASGVVMLVRRNRAAAGVAVASVLAAAAAHIGEQEWIQRILGGSYVGLPGGPGVTSGFLAGRANSFTLTWLRPGYDTTPLVALALVLMVGALVVGVVAARRDPDEPGPVVAFGVVAAGAAVLALVAGPTNIVPGLLVAFPVAAAGLVAIRRSTLAAASPAAPLALGTFAVFAVAVAGTQYVTGGSGEWGGRYFAVGIPVLGPVLVLALASVGRTLRPVARRVGVAALVTCSIAMTIMGVSGLRDTHRVAARLHATVAAAGHGTGSARPVIVATHPIVPRLAWATIEDQRWLLARPDRLGPVLSRLGAAGVHEFLVVTADMERDADELDAEVDIVARRKPAPGSMWQVLTVRTRA